MEKTTKMRIKETIVRALKLAIKPEEIGDDDILFGGEIGLNSMAMIEMIVGLEDEFEIKVADEDLGGDVFQSVNSIACYVESQFQKTA